MKKATYLKGAVQIPPSRSCSVFLSSGVDQVLFMNTDGCLTFFYRPRLHVACLWLHEGDVGVPVTFIKLHLHPQMSDFIYAPSSVFRVWNPAIWTHSFGFMWCEKEMFSAGSQGCLIWPKMSGGTEPARHKLSTWQKRAHTWSFPLVFPFCPCQRKCSPLSMRVWRRKMKPYPKYRRNVLPRGKCSL